MKVFYKKIQIPLTGTYLPSPDIMDGLSHSWLSKRYIQIIQFQKCHIKLEILIYNNYVQPFWSKLWSLYNFSPTTFKWPILVTILSSGFHNIINDGDFGQKLVPFSGNPAKDMIVTDSKILSTREFRDETVTWPASKVVFTNIQTEEKTMGAGATCSQNRIGSDPFGESYGKKERRRDLMLVYQYADPRVGGLLEDPFFSF